MRGFVHETGVKLSADITKETASSWIYTKGADNTQRDYYDDLYRFVKFLLRQNYILKNPLADLPRPIVRLKTPAVLTFD